MANEFRKVTDQNGVNHPVCDDTRMTWEANATLGAHQLLPLTLAGIKALNSARTWEGNVTTHNGITFTVNTNANGYVTSISTSGSASSFAFLRLASVASFSGNFKLNGGIDNERYCYIQNETTNTGLVYSYGGDANIALSPTANVVNCIIAVNQGGAGGVTFYPLLRLEEDNDPTFTPYAMTNRELTEKVVKHSLIDITLPEAISKNQFEEVLVLSSYDLRNKIPEINEAISVEYMWSNGSRCVPINQYLSGRHYTLNLLALAQVTVETVRLNVSYI